MKKLAALLLAALLVLCAAGCSGQPAASATNAPATKAPAATQAPAQDAPQASADAAPEETSVYPIEGDSPSRISDSSTKNSTATMNPMTIFRSFSGGRKPSA